MASSVVETCLGPRRFPWKENPAFKGESINRRCPNIFQEYVNGLGFPF